MPTTPGVPPVSATEEVQREPASATHPEPGAAVTRGGEAISEKQAWGALWALLVGFFMILVDSTIVTTAIPAIMQALDTSVNGVVWVTSAYLLTYAVPLLVTGRLGDRYGPRNVFIVGLVVFTASSAWCGMSTTIGMLIAARAVQGLGAALMTPQSMAVITRLFAYQRRGAAMGLWGSTAGVATLVGPILGGVLVDSLGWQWIFVVNVPFGLFGVWQVWRKVPDLPRVTHRFDWLGVALSGVGVFCLVFGLQEGNSYNWGTISGPLSVPLLLGAGVLIMAGFVWWEARGPAEPLVPLGLFRTWNFTLGNILTFCMGVAVTSMTFPMMIFLQDARYLSPTQAALTMVPNAVVSGVLAPLVGRAFPRLNARVVIVGGLALFALTLFSYQWLVRAGHPVWQLVVLAVPMGVSGALIWGPISLTTTRDLRSQHAGAGSSVFNTTRQMGSVLGSALIAMLMTRRIGHWIADFTASHPAARAGTGAQQGQGHVPPPLSPYFARAMADSILLPAVVIAVGALVALLVHTHHREPAR